MIRWIAVIAAALLAGGLWIAGRQWQLRARAYWRTGFALAATLLLGSLLGLVPLGTTGGDETVSNTDIVFLADVTYSMNAQDGRSNESRLANMRTDIQSFAAKLAGSRFGIVTFDHDTSIYLPLTATTADVDIAAQTLQTKDYHASTQSPDLTTALKQVKSYLDQSAKVDATRQRVLVVLTDGELTGSIDTADSIHGAAAALHGSINAAVVIGYGADRGATLPYLENNFTTDYEQRVHKDLGPIEAPDSNGTYREIRTKRDEPSLRALAEALHGTYVPAEQTNKTLNTLSESRLTAARNQSHSSENTALRQNIMHIPFALLLFMALCLLELVQLPQLRRLVTGKRRHI